MTNPQLWPIFICYRRADGIASARRLHEILNKWKTTEPDGKPIQIDAYLDETMPGVENWKELHRPYLEKARAMIVICTPGAKLNEGPDDYVHNEINWWLQHRKVAPILIDPLMEGLRFVPSQIVHRYPDIQRITLVEKEWKNLTGEALKEKTAAIQRQILGAILPSGAEIYEQELEQERLRTRRLRLALSVSIALLIATLVIGVYAFFQRQAAVMQRDRAENQEGLARKAAAKAQKQEKIALEAQAITEQQRKEVQKQADIARKAAAKAQKQEKIALEAKAIAERQRKEAQKQAELARRSTYNIQLARVRDLWQRDPVQALETP